MCAVIIFKLILVIFIMLAPAIVIFILLFVAGDPYECFIVILNIYLVVG